MKPTEAEVRLHGRRVGVFTYAKGGSTFRYQDDLLSVDHQTLGQTFEESPGAVRREHVGLPAWFANLLPEGELRRQVIREMGGGNIGDFKLLLRLGSDLPGAVTVHGPEPDDSDDPTATDAARTAADEEPLRYSLAGVQLKYSVHSSRLTLPARGLDGWWIVKLPDPNLQQLEDNEFLTMNWLRAAGMDVPEVLLLPARSVPNIPEGYVAPDDRLYLVRRFDRTSEGRVHVEDFAQMFDAMPQEKYGQFGATCDNVGAAVKTLLGEDGFRQYLARLVAALLTGNTDAHLKNWGLRYADGRTPTLSPVYDFHSLTVYRRFRYAPLALSLGGEKMPSLVDWDNFRRLAEVAGSDPEAAVGVVAKTVDAMRAAWHNEVRQEVRARFVALADHYDERLSLLPVAR